jgi:hypothetical protein
VNVNTQNNIGNGLMAGSPNALTSPEAVIRSIRAERGYALTDGAPVQDAEVIPVSEGDEDEPLDDEADGEEGDEDGE